MRHFVADASHELRTPLTSIAGYIDVLGRREVVDAETLQASLAAMQQESTRMTRLVNDLLTLTRFESGKAPSRQPLQLDQFVNQALDELSLRDKGAHESRDFQPGVTVKADPSRPERAQVRPRGRTALERLYRGRARRHPAAGHGAWDLAAGPAAHLRALLPRGKSARPVDGRLGAGPGDRQIDCRGAPGNDRGGERARPGSDLYGLAAAGGLALQADDRRDLNRHAQG